ncbi:MAG: hypothetical protein KAV87_31050, partial [Desulfobacteraceae bacterium]|nr:hypothetical protein [Desulfobacteraceae bacterium]
PDFFAKDWPQIELDGLVAKEIDGKKVILPVWHNIGHNEVKKYSPILAGRIAVKTADGLDEVVRKIMQVVNPTNIYISDGKRADVASGLISGKVDDFHRLIAEADARFEMHCSQSDSNITKMNYGRWSVAHQLVPTLPEKTLKKLYSILKLSQIEETGWPIGEVLNTEELRPHPWNDVLEAWIVTQEPPRLDYWFAKPSGFFYATRAFNEDFAVQTDKPLFEWIDPIRHMGEAILHATRVAKGYEVPIDHIIFLARYGGLTGRKLWNRRRQSIMGPREDYVCRTDSWSKEILVQPDLDIESLPSIVQELLKPLYEKFDLFEMPSQVYLHQLKRMIQGT